MREFDRRILKHLGNQPTPALSQFPFWGRRKAFRRELDREKGGGVDIYSAALLFLTVLIVGLNILDSRFKMMVQDLGAWEVNPTVRSVVEFYGDRFWVWKFAIVSVPLILLCIHSKFSLAITAILGVCAIKVAVVLYQIFLIMS